MGWLTLRQSIKRMDILAVVLTNSHSKPESCRGRGTAQFQEQQAASTRFAFVHRM
jgi:hypothetical protein